MSSRRKFLKELTLGVMGMTVPVHTFGASNHQNGYFGVHPFIENHPEAVFIMLTNVDHKMNDRAKLRAGLRFSRNIFVHRDNTGIPLNVSIPVKANLKSSILTNMSIESLPIQPIKNIQGTATDPYFLEGVMEGIKELGVLGKQFHLREVNRPENFEKYGFVDMIERVGGDLRRDLSPIVGVELEEERDYNWTEISDGIALTKVPHLEPINTQGTWLLNIAKMKSHLMGMTLCCKNLQGSIAHNYQRLCADLRSQDAPTDYQCDEVIEKITANYWRHCHENRIPRWDLIGEVGGIWQETWATRTIDHVSATPCGLHMIEGIYSRDNDGYFGVHPIDVNHVYMDSNPEAVKKYGRRILQGKSMTGSAKDYMTNFIIFGMNPYYVDTLGFWLAGHEPGNFGLFHLALERGMITTFDPSQIPLYLWDDSTASVCS